MTSTVTLFEYEDWRGHLDDEDAAYLGQLFGRRITVRRELAHDGAEDVLNPNQYVGVIILPSGRRLEALPKADVRNVFYMLSVSSGIRSPFLDQLAGYETFEELLEFVASYFAELVQQQVDRGLFRDYIEAEENLAYVRGRIAIAQDIGHNFVLRHRTYCRFAEFTWDIPENQVLRQAAHQLQGWGFSHQTRQRLAAIDSALAEVSRTQHAPSTIARFQYHRGNEHYRDLHALRRLFLEGESLAEHEGATPFQTFLLDMNRLFERYVCTVAEEAFHTATEWVHSQGPTFLDSSGRIVMRPDIAVLRGRGDPVLIADAKYKRLIDGEFINHDLYQMLDYLVANEVPYGLLVYPRHVSHSERVTAVRNARQRIEQFSFALNGTVEQLRVEEVRLAEKLRELCG